ncbi:MAG TPA: hypothetical protein VFV70_07550 [Hyphomonadaceae bacterium]|nr:hypothetical protein [Hyphomonadaceae bacterium]
MTDATIGGSASKVSSRWFYAWMGLTTVAVALIGFMPTYFIPLMQGQFVAPPIIHIHGLIFFGWTLLFASQTFLVARGNTLAHRSWGMLGVAWATAMVFVVFATVAVRINLLSAAGYRTEALAFSWVQIGGILLFAAIFVLAIVNVKKSEVHKRLMLLGTVALLDAPIARWFLVFLAPPVPAGEIAPPPPLFVTVPPALVADLLILVAMAYDWRTRGKPHPVYLIGGAVVLAYQVTRPLIGGTEAWQSVAAWIGSWGG